MLCAWTANAQTQVVKGNVIDAKAAYPLIGASIIIVGSDPIIGATTDHDGNFRIENVPIGRQTLAVQFVGYKSISVPNVLVTSGKQSMLYLKLEESVESLEEIVVSAQADKDKPINELAKVSARTFSMEEVTRFSGGRNDAARMVASFAGVSAPNDSRNDIVVRGNSPIGLLWKVEGLPVATVNHYATLGTTGGPVSALNTNLLRTSDFMTGAFPAEYGNANASVFDINFRNGNTDKYEFTGQVSAFSGLEFMAEGPISKKNNSSFVASYRYGIASVAATGTSATPYYQDFNFKVNLGKTKIGRFELFGLGGRSSIDFYGNEIDETDLFANPNENAFINNDLGMIGLNHTVHLNQGTYIKTTFGAATNSNEYEQFNIIRDENGNEINNYLAVHENNTENRYTVNSTLNKKFNSRWNLRTGVIVEIYDVDFSGITRDNQADIPDEDMDSIPDYIRTYRDIQDRYTVSQAFAQASYNISDSWNATFGLHGQYHSYTEASVLEPRAGISWQAKPNQRWSFGYGMHSQSIPSPVLFLEEPIEPGVYERTNENLDFTKSHHFVLGYDRNMGPDWRLKTELYYQYLYDVPVESTPSSYSLLNEGADFIFSDKGSLVNEGTGTNYGIELTLEKFFSNNYYLLSTASIFESKYEGSDGIERSTAFDYKYVYNLLFGKEWKFGREKQNAWTFDTKLTTSGGKPYTPIDLEGTRNNAGEEVRYDDQAFSQRYATYFRWDVKFGVRINSAKKKISHQFYIDLQNVTNRENEFVYRYNEVTDEVNKVSQIGFFPDVMYRIQF